MCQANSCIQNGEFMRTKWVIRVTNHVVKTVIRVCTEVNLLFRFEIPLIIQGKRRIDVTLAGSIYAR